MEGSPPTCFCPAKTRRSQEKPLSHRTLLKEHSKGRPLKLPLDHTLAVYFDTSYLCHPSRNYKQQDDDWEGPFKSRLAAQRAFNMGSDHPLPSMSPVPPISNKHFLNQSVWTSTETKYPLSKQIQSESSCGNNNQGISRDPKTSNRRVQENDEDEDQFKDLKEQIKLQDGRQKLNREYVMPPMNSFNNGMTDNEASRGRQSQIVSRANKELQTSFDYDRNVNDSYRPSYNNSNGSSNRELVYKSKRSVSREGMPGNNIFNGETCVST
ncbi:hypothetical protein FHG87_025397 [Trinorchestia longiramus]|nr:hypothetical protein FHG87_025397 [Trinorchestia longiramus]